MRPYAFMWSVTTHRRLDPFLTRCSRGARTFHVSVANKAPYSKLQSWTLSSYIAGQAVTREGTFENPARLPHMGARDAKTEHEYRAKAVPAYSGNSS